LHAVERINNNRKGTYCSVSVVIVVTRKRHNVTLYVHYLSLYFLLFLMLRPLLFQSLVFSVSFFTAPPPSSHYTVY
jgi:hypothetical protein